MANRAVPSWFLFVHSQIWVRIEALAKEWVYFDLNFGVFTWKWEHCLVRTGVVIRMHPTGHWSDAEMLPQATSAFGSSFSRIKLIVSSFGTTFAFTLSRTCSAGMPSDKSTETPHRRVWFSSFHWHQTPMSMYDKFAIMAFSMTCRS